MGRTTVHTRIGTACLVSLAITFNTVFHVMRAIATGSWLLPHVARCEQRESSQHVTHVHGDTHTHTHTPYKQLMEVVQAGLGDLGNDADAIMELLQALIDDLRLQQRPQLALENNKALLAQLTGIMGLTLRRDGHDATQLE